MSNKLSFENNARKKRPGEKDLKDKFDVIKILRSEFGLHGITGESILIPDSIPVQYYRLPDIVIASHDIIIELDGPIHGNGDDISKRKKDVERDNDYKKTKYKLVIINYEELPKGYGKEKVIHILEKSGLKRKCQN